MLERMYYRDYGDRDPGREVYAGLPQEGRGNLAEIDYSKAGGNCPRGPVIAELMRGACRVLTQGQCFEEQGWPAAAKLLYRTVDRTSTDFSC